MDFKDATDQIAIAVTHNDIARAAGASVQTVRQARLDPANRAHRPAPSDWRRALADLARARSDELLRLADTLEREYERIEATSFSLFRYDVSAMPVRLPSGRRISLKRSRVTFAPWTGDAIRNRYGGRPVVEFGGRPLFPELAVLHALRNDGWDGVWIDGLRQKNWIDLPERSDPVTLPARPTRLLRSIVRRNGGLAGAWEVFAWKDDEHLFARPLHCETGRMLASQLRWIESCLLSGLTEDAFRVVEWEPTPS